MYSANGQLIKLDESSEFGITGFEESEIVRPGLDFCYGGEPSYCPHGSKMEYWWGVKVDGRFIWRNIYGVAFSPDNLLTRKQVRAFGLRDTASWFKAMSRRFKKL